MVNNANLVQKVAKMHSGDLTCTQNVQDFLAEIEKNNKKYNIFLEINENALNQAKKLDEKQQNGAKLGKFFGLTFAIKSNISVEDMTISCASKTLDNYRGTFNADVIKTILAEDGIILGILNNDEFANGISGETSAFGNTLNPASKGRVPGGSSSGSGAVIAANMADVALGSDTGGSIRNPASHCGIVGIKPSYGRVSRYGLVDLSMSLDQIGPLTRDVESTAFILENIAGFSENDSVTKDIAIQDLVNSKPDSNLKIGYIKEFEDVIAEPQIKELYTSKLSLLKERGYEIKELSIKNISLAVEAYYPIVYVEFFSGTRKFDSVKYGHKFEESVNVEALRRALGGQEISRSEFDGAYYKKALKVKELIADELSEAFKQVDIILAPVSPEFPHKFGDNPSVEASYAVDAFTTPSNLAGICAGVVSVDKLGDEKIPVGIQVMADSFREDNLVKGLYLLESLK